MFRFAACNEMFGKMAFEQVCRTLQNCGYTGIEIAPFTLAETPAAISRERRRELRGIIAGENLAFAGLHWLLVSPPGMHVTTPDNALRHASWEHVRRLIHLSGDLAGDDGSVMVFGSPQQRGTTRGASVEEATQRFTDGLRSVAADAEARRVTILVEALPASQCDVIQTLAEAAAVVEAAGSPAVATMFDTHNTAGETEVAGALIQRYANIIRHIHVNEMDGRYPGTGDYDFKSVFRALREISFAGWISLEVFDFNPDPVTIARESLQFLKSQT